MNSYLEVLQDKAKKIGADIEMCGFDKECITNVIAKKVRSNLEHEDLSVIKEKAIIIEANISVNNADKSSILDAIEEKIKEVTGGVKSRCIPFNEEHLSDVCVCCGKPAKHMVFWGKQY